MRWPGPASKRRRVDTPTRLLSSEMPIGMSPESRSTSNTENGRRSSGSWLRRGLTMTNCPGFTWQAISGAASAITL
jgi:hypothetical protein